MRVIIAETSGFCGGVKRAMRIAVEAAARHGGLVSDGPLVHNSQALALLSLHAIDSDMDADGGRPVLVRAHGVPPERRTMWLDEGRTLVDATCLHVARNQRLAAEAAARGEFVVLAGDVDHAEVKAVAASAGSRCLVAESVADLGAVPPGPAFLLAQTTFNVELFAEMAAALRISHPDAVVADTICRATRERQDEAAKLAARVDAVVVVGGKNSANTRRLAETCARTCGRVFAIETASELSPDDFAGLSTVGVISGASTPGWITQDVVNRLRPMGKPSLSAAVVRVLLPLVQARVSTALSAFGLALSAQFWLLGGIRPALALAGAGFVFFAHTLNRRVPGHLEARRLSLVDSFYQDRRPALLTFAWLSAAGALALSWLHNPVVFALFLLAVISTAAYALYAKKSVAGFGPPRVSTYLRSIFMAVGWAMTLAWPVVLESGRALPGAGAMLFVFLLCVGGNLLRDLRDIASDSLMGMETLPARIGTAAARRLAGWAMGVAALLPLAAALSARAGAVSGHALFLVLLSSAPAIGLFLLKLLERRKMNDDVLLQAGVDGMGCVAGLLALIFGAFA